MSYSNKNMKDLCDIFKLNRLIKDPTCFKRSSPSCIDNFCTNKMSMFFNSSTVETGISDHHRLICTILRSTFCKGPAKFIHNRSYNNYNKEQFENVLKQRLASSSHFEEFFDKFLATLNENAPLKKKKIRYNHQVFMSKTLRKAIMKRSKLRNIFNKKRSSESWQNDKRLRNIYSNTLKATKKTFFGSLSINEITDERKFRKTVTPFSSDKCKTSKNTVITEKNETLKDNKNISNTFSQYFTTITKGLNLRESKGNINFGNEESCKKVKENFGNETFSFGTISKKDVLDLIKQLLGNKFTVSNDIPVSVLKESVSAHQKKLTGIFNNCLRSSTFPEILKKAEVKNSLKKVIPHQKGNIAQYSTKFFKNF